MADQPDNPETVLLGTQAGTDTPAPPVVTVLPEVPGYRVLSVLGRGGMGQVFLAEHLQLRRQVALKLLAAGVAASPALLSRFQAESRAVAAVKHSGVCQIFEAGQIGQVPFLAMENIEGRTLSQAIREQMPSAIQAAKFLVQIAEAVGACHQAGILHRDLKPSNVMLTRQGEIKVMDFGLAKLQGENEDRTRTGEILGTPSYMAPEQASGVVKQLGPECDVYALGAILYELLTGRPPFQTPEALQTVMLVLTTDPIPPRKLQPRVPVDLETICLKCLEKVPHKRYRTTAALVEDLERFLGSRPILARQTPAWEKTWKWVRRHPASSVLLLMACLAAIGTLSGAWFHVSRLQTELNRWQRMFDESQEFGSWLVNDYIPRVAQLPGGGSQQMALVNKTLQHLQFLQAEAANDVQLARYVAQAYLRIAEVQSDPAYATPARIEQALASDQRALDLYPSLAAGDEHVNLSFERAQILISMSRLHMRIDQNVEATQCLDQALVLLQALAPTAPADADRPQTEISLSLYTAEEFQARLGADGRSPEEARARLQQIEQAVEALPEEQLSQESALQQQRHLLLARLAIDQAETFQNLDGDDEKSIKEQLKWYQRAVQEFQVAGALDILARQTLASTLEQISLLNIQQSEFAEGTRQSEKAVELRRQLVQEFPQSEILLSELLDSLTRLFKTALPYGDNDSSMAIAEQQFHYAEELYLLDPDAFRGELQRAHALRAKALRKRLLYDAASEQMRKAVELAQQPAVETQTQAEQLATAELLWDWAELLQEQGQQRSTLPTHIQLLQQAIELLEENQAIYEQLGQGVESPPDSPYWKTIDFKHRLERDLEQLMLRNQERGGPFRLPSTKP